MSVSIGICTSPDRIAQVAPGYAFSELGVASTLMPLEDDVSFAPYQAQLAALQPAIAAFNGFVAPHVKLTGPNTDWDQITTYVKNALRRAGGLGADVVVFGSGGARNVPEGYEHQAAWDQLVCFLRLCADEAERNELVVAIEPLNHRESNILNSYSEGVAMAREVDRRAVRVLADIYHFEEVGEPLEDILEAPDMLAHVHLADTGRLYPGSGTYPLVQLFEIMHRIGYQGKASVECGWGDDYTAETAAALAFLTPLAR
ncbi:MAG: sugar phosphate isomerase/epimerase [Chloroflexi bacterium]|nr:sugar phosphate isomerase/epimerase [Chloroflexota bacterium]